MEPGTWPGLQSSIVRSQICGIFDDPFIIRSEEHSNDHALSRGIPIDTLSSHQGDDFIINECFPFYMCEMVSILWPFEIQISSSELSAMKSIVARSYFVMPSLPALPHNKTSFWVLFTIHSLNFKSVTGWLAASYISADGELIALRAIGPLQYIYSPSSVFGNSAVNRTPSALWIQCMTKHAIMYLLNILSNELLNILLKVWAHVSLP